VIKKLRSGVSLRVDAYNRDKSQRLAPGKLLTVDNQIDPTTGTLRLKAVFDNKESTLYPMQFVNVRLLVETRQGQVIVPSVAIQRGSQGTFVYIVKADKTVEVRPVTVGVTEANTASIDRGLEAGEMVVTDGADKLQPGSKVTVRTDTGVPVRGNSAVPAGSRPAGGPSA
jgi:multidrug efflux system membrane fusion protein